MAEAKFFKSQKDFRRWLEKNHARENELLVGFYKVRTNKPSMTWSESVDQALCFGWIDGVRRSLGDESYSIRFTPRRPDSVWSLINIRKAQELIENRLMQPAGLVAFEKRSKKKSGIYAYENEPRKLDPELEDRIRKNENAWAFFEKQPAWYRRNTSRWVMEAKQEKTRTSRLEKLILACEAGKRV